MDSKIVDKLYDDFDEACMLLYEELDLDYLSALKRVSSDLLEGINDSKLSDEALSKLESIYQAILNSNIDTKDEIRIVLQLLSIKAFKHLNYPLDIMVPDTISYLIGDIISKKYHNKNISILDTTLKGANMLLTINNYLNNQHNLLYGIEEDEKLIDLAIATSNILSSPIEIFYQDILKGIPNKVDVVIGNLESYDYEKSHDSSLYRQGVRYTPYLISEARLENLNLGSYFVYLISNDFFSKPDCELYKSFLESQATLVGLIVLPNSIVQANQIGKSILIGKKEVLQDFDMMIVNIKNFERETLKEAIYNINKMLEKI